MITKEQVMPLFLEACPSFGEKWDDHHSLYADEQLLYVDMGEFAHHLVELHKSNQTTEFRAIFDIIERLHIDGDHYVKEAATIGMLEAIQNVASNNGVDPRVFVPYLGTKSIKWWAQLNDFWQTKYRTLVPPSTRHNNSGMKVGVKHRDLPCRQSHE